MTACCTALGLVPILLSGGVGAEIEKPLAAVMVGGLFTSTVFTLLVIPVVHYTVTRLAERIGLKTIPPLVELEMDAVPSDPPAGG